jgi:hypothetical protein
VDFFSHLLASGLNIRRTTHISLAVGCVVRKYVIKKEYILFKSGLVGFRFFVRGFQELVAIRANPTAKVKFIIFGRGRSGSTALVSLLQSSEGIHCDGEILNQLQLTPYFHVFARCRRANSAVYGCKILSYQLRDVQPIIDARRFLRKLTDAGFKIIYLKRDNLLLHAVSNVRAREFGFHKVRDREFSPGKVKLDPKQLLSWMEKSEKLDEYEKHLLVDIEHLPLTYEEDLEFEESHIETLEEIAFLDVKIGEAKVGLSKISPTLIRDSIENFVEVENALLGTKYEKYLAVS